MSITSQPQQFDIVQEQPVQQASVPSNTVIISDYNLTATNYSISIMMILSMVAIFLSFKCNGGKFNAFDLMLALLFAPIYIPIRLGTSWGKCIA